jgi:hypothetical protein
VTAILVQVKNVKQFECSIDETVFDRMDPFSVGLFDEGSQKPVIRMVFALASPTPGILFPDITEYTSTNSSGVGEFTAFDIWCAGLSSFKNIGDDLTSYQSLLEHSLRPHWHDAFELGETDDLYLDTETRSERGRLRRRMAALTMDNINHLSAHV